MNTLTTPHPPDTERLRVTANAPPTTGPTPTLADRLSLRLGLWLLLRSTRRLQSDASYEAHSRRLHNERARAARESATAHEHLLRSVRA